MPEKTILFVCEHGAAKSILAAAHFNQLAVEKNLGLRAVARGTHPDPELSPQTITGLRTDGLTPTETSPQQLSPADFDHAERVVTFCELPAEFQNKISTERWDDIPPVSENYMAARDAILEKLHRLPLFSSL
jgi:protein-tyrosine-phosphatase